MLHKDQAFQSTGDYLAICKSTKVGVQPLSFAFDIGRKHLWCERHDEVYGFRGVYQHWSWQAVEVVSLYYLIYSSGEWQLFCPSSIRSLVAVTSRDQATPDNVQCVSGK